MKSQLLLIKRIFKELPKEIGSFIWRALPIAFISSLLDAVSISILFPVINFTLFPEKIKESGWANSLYNYFQFESNNTFLSFLFISVLVIFIIKNIIFYFINLWLLKKTFQIATDLAIRKMRTQLNHSLFHEVNQGTSEQMRNIIQLPIELMVYHALPVVNVINELFLIVLITLGIALFNLSLFVSIILFILPLYFLFSWRNRKLLVKLNHEKDLSSKAIFKNTNKLLESVLEIRLFKKRTYFEKEFKETMENFSEVNKQFNLLNLFSPKIIETIGVFAIVGVYLFGQVLHISITEIANFLVIFAIASFRLIPSLNKVVLNTNYIKSSAYIADHFLESTLWRESRSQNSEPIAFRKELTLQDVKIEFDGRTILEFPELSFAKNESVAIIGESGSGKSTLLTMLFGDLPNHSTGTLSVDGKTITDSNKEAYLSLISVVPQKVQLIEGTLEDNICFGIPEELRDRKRIQEVIEQANLTTYIASLSLGLQNHVNERTTNLSGGQKQRIAIARALYHGGEILLFDEATSALDTETESVLLEEIQALKALGKTIIVVTHKQNSLHLYERVIRIKAGKISNES
ncbi:MAG: ATP-binding cassette domain-containing protein [Fluviicola sp.]